VKDYKETSETNTVLVVSNDIDVLDDIKQSFSFCIPEVNLKTVRSINNISEVIKSFNPQCIVLDLDYNKNNTCDLISTVRALTKAYLITLSYIQKESLVVDAIDKGSNCHINKPIKPMEFIAYIKGGLKRSTQ
jgi:DNA-binding response OmpR family regulator